MRFHGNKTSKCWGILACATLMLLGYATAKIYRWLWSLNNLYLIHSFLGVVQALKEEQRVLAQEAKEWVASFPDPSVMVASVQSLGEHSSLTLNMTAISPILLCTNLVFKIRCSERKAKSVVMRNLPHVREQLGNSLHVYVTVHLLIAIHVVSQFKLQYVSGHSFILCSEWASRFAKKVCRRM